DRVVRGMAKKETEAIKQWRKDFIRPFKTGEIKTLLRMSDAVDKLWQRHAADCARIRFQTRSAYNFFGYDDGNIYKHTLTTKQKDDLYNRELLSENVPNSSPFRRLKLVMDYWCALWFWPIQEADKLPSRDEFLMDLTLILEGTVYETRPVAGEQLPLIPDNRPKQQDLDFTNEFGHVNVDALCNKKVGIERLALVRDLAEKHYFHHWDLVFADIFADRGGFDLNIGNPPWIKIEWNEGGLLGDYDPLLVIRNISAAQLATMREESIEKRGIRDEYLSEYVAFEGTQNFLNSLQNYPILKGTQSNLYKCFLPQSWHIGTERGVSGFLHPEGVYDDPKGGRFREAIYPRLRYHFQFQNELNLFGDVDHHVKFSINIGTAQAENQVTFSHLANLFSVSTVDACFLHGGGPAVGGIKDDQNNWNIAGHKDRIAAVDEETLTLFARLYDDARTPALQARLPVVHSRQVVEVLRKFAAQPKRLGDLAGEYFSTVMWDEANAQKAGTIKRSTKFAGALEKWILSGPHFYVANPLNKTPRAICRLNSDYDPLDLTAIPDDYLPRTNYLPAYEAETYSKRTPNVNWDSNLLVTDFFNLIHRRMLSQAGERTLISAIIPKSCGHIHTVISTCFKRNSVMLNAQAMMMSIPFDFYVKSMGKSDFTAGYMAYVPLSKNDIIKKISQSRVLILNCLTTHYAELWEESWDEAFRQEHWTKVDPRLDNGRFADLTPIWQRNCALRTDYERRARPSWRLTSWRPWLLASLWMSSARFTGSSSPSCVRMRTTLGMTGMVASFSPAARASPAWASPARNGTRSKT
ncbi:MAG: hypothetical protein ABH845_05750, partial [Candidatus Omnitrophota bacterium]